MIMISTNELRFLKNVLDEIEESGESLELDEAIELVNGMIVESRKLEGTLEQYLEDTATKLIGELDEQEI